MNMDNKCPHCKMDIAIRNPSGFCDHLYYPDYCEVCKKREGKDEEDKLIKFMQEYLDNVKNVWGCPICGHDHYATTPDEDAIREFLKKLEEI